MLVKCQCCGNKVDRNEAFKVVVGERNTYYCNENEYKSIIQDREYKRRMFLCINDIFEYKVVNTALFKEINEIHKSFSFEHIFKYLRDNKEDIIAQLSRRSFQNEYNQIRYFSAILKNNLSDYVETKEDPIKIIEVDIPKDNYKRKTKRRSLSEIEESW